jgi:hypothetical protein
MSPKKRVSGAHSQGRSPKNRPVRKNRLSSVHGQDKSAGPDATSPAKSEAAVVEVRIAAGDNGVISRVSMKPELTRQAADWMYVLRNRSRWAGDDDHRSALSERAVKTLSKFGIGEDVIRGIVAADSRHVELKFTEPDASNGLTSNAADSASAFPWEFVLSVATRKMGRSRPLLITRTLGRAQAPAMVAGELLFLESAPGRLKGIYTFESERMRLKAAMGQQFWKILRSPTLSKLSDRIASINPRVIHVSGVDNHQAGQVLKDFYKGKNPPSDGIVMSGSEQPVPYSQFAAALVGQVKPQLVTLNGYYSATRTARECVRGGAQAAIGFFDEVDDELAEYFFQAFYWAWNKWGSTVNALPRALGHTWNLMKNRGQDLFGTGIVLWLASSAFETERMAAFVSSSSSSDESPEDALESRLPTAEELKQSRSLPINEVLQVGLSVPDEINYSLLHNSRKFLQTLTLTKLVEHALDEVKVEVQLNAGDSSLPFRHTETLLNQPQRALADEVRIPLTAALLRSSRERIQSTLYVRVAWDNRIACEETKSITLLPVDEWFDDTEKNPWLPSFVLPRDPSITRIVTAARRHLVTLQDDPVAGFDGYQSVDLENDDCECVDAQVQALWTTLVQEFRLAYINPPPAYSERNQRLRTPSEIVTSSSGTCIDLALLLASCLEYVDIYPVVVLLSGHAFVGYWRADSYHEDFCECKRVPAMAGIEVGPVSATSAVSLVDPYGWRLAQQHYREILDYLRLDQIRFLEATGLCFNYSYAEAVEEGRSNLKSPEDFDSLLDITLARRAKPPVTPLPMILAGREI